MTEILAIEGTNVKVGTDGGKLITIPLATLAFTNPVVGDKINVYRDGDKIIVKRVSPSGQMVSGDHREVNKILYILMCLFFGGIGVHRFLRGQVGLGICMIFFNVLTLGIWAFVDFIISLVKLSSYKDGDMYIFTPDGKWVR